MPQALEDMLPEEGRRTDYTTVDRKEIDTNFGRSMLEEQRTTYHSMTGVQIDKRIATYVQVRHLQRSFPLPNTSASMVARRIHWSLITVYQRIFGIVFLANMIALASFISRLSSQSRMPAYESAITAAAANLCTGVVMRNEHVVNILFRLAVRLPLRTPLCVRKRAAKIYSYGGVHSSTGVAGSIWYLVYSGLIAKQHISRPGSGFGIVLATGFTVILLLLILTLAHPSLRRRLHDHFELSHRFAGWAVVACLWLQIILLVFPQREAHHRTFVKILLATPSFWFLLVTTLCILYPWTRLRSRKVRFEPLSKHAVFLHFEYTNNMETGVTIRLTDAPLRETHSFATIPNYRGAGGFSILMSNAGDWTEKIMTDPPDRLWIRGAPTFGVIRVALMFQPLLVIATGSGIGPCLSLLQNHRECQMRVLWSVRSPRTTYGDDVINAVIHADPEAVIIDTEKTGRGDLVALAYSTFRQSGAEAAVIISNATATDLVVKGLESRGIPIYGPIFDS